MVDINAIVTQIKNDDNVQLRNQFIDQYRPFIIGVTSKVTGRYVTAFDSDEFSMALIGFNHAIDRYDMAKGNFLSFAETIIRHRIIDFLRQERIRSDRVISNEEYLNALPSKVNEELVNEIRIFKKELEGFDIKFFELSEVSPTQKNVLQEVTALGKKISKDTELVKKLYRTRKLPINEIRLKYGQSKKRLKLFRAFIIAIIVVEKEELLLIQSYMDIGGK